MNQEDMNYVDSLAALKADLVHFASLAVAGDVDAARVFGMRRVRELMKRDAALAHALRNALVSSPKSRPQSGASAVRRASPVPESSETDGAEELLRIEEVPSLPTRPHYADGVGVALHSVVTEHKSSDSLKKVGLSPTKTLLLSGPPGVGKTLAASWLAREMNQRLFVLDLSTVMSRYLGATGANLKRAFHYARQTDGVLFLDELDALAKRRDDDADVGELKRLVTVLLQQLDEWPAGRLLVAATNHPQLLDNAVWRRFEARIEFPRPETGELRTLLHALTPSGIELPPLWESVLPLALAKTSQSEFVRIFSQLLKVSVLEPSVSPADALSRVIGHRMNSLSRKEAKAIALALANDGGLSKRQIAELTHVSRDTMRRAGIHGG